MLTVALPVLAFLGTKEVRGHALQVGYRVWTVPRQFDEPPPPVLIHFPSGTEVSHHQQRAMTTTSINDNHNTTSANRNATNHVCEYDTHVDGVIMSITSYDATPCTCSALLAAAAASVVDGRIDG